MAASGTSPNQQLVLADNPPSTETILVYGDGLAYNGGTCQEVEAALEPSSWVNLVTRALVERLGRQGDIRPASPNTPQDPTGSTNFHSDGTIDLDIIIPRSKRKSWSATCFVVEHRAHDIVLGYDLCKKALIVPGMELGPFLAVQQSKEDKKAEDEAHRKAKEEAEKKEAEQARQMLIQSTSKPKQDTVKD